MVAGKSAPYLRHSSNTGRFYKRLFRLTGNERLYAETDQAQAHAHTAGAMALDGLGLAGGFLAAGACMGRGLDGLRLRLGRRLGSDSRPGSMTVAWTFWTLGTSVWGLGLGPRTGADSGFALATGSEATAADSALR